MSITYKIIRSKRKTLAIQIMPSGQVIVRSPLRLSRKEIQAFVDSKRDWIDKHLSKPEMCELEPLGQYELEHLRKQAKILISERVAYFAEIMGVSYNKITIRAQRSRWGSCSSIGNLNFNCLLALVPDHVLDYVVVHELCHLRHMNHGKEFWAEVEAVLLDFQRSRKWLKEEGSALINRIR